MITPPNSDGLNEKQKQSVTLSEDTSALILAGAGSGKTRVLTHRIHYLVSEKNYYSDDILAVRFTNKAANEMKERLSELLYQPIGRMWVGTFHSLAHRLLRAHAIDANLSPTFQILDAQDQFRIIKRLMKENGVDETKFPIRKVQWFINQQKDEGLQPHNIDEGYNFFVKQSTKIFDLYEKHCQANDLIDFAGLLMKSYELLKNNSSLLEHYQNKFKHILVDEFQDTNRIQYQFIKILHNENNHIFCVGDDDQSIYGWRGARIENIQKIENTTNYSKGLIGSELHTRMHKPIFCFVAAILGFSALLIGNANRFGFSKQITMALLVIVLMKVIESYTIKLSINNFDLWPLIYLPSTIGIFSSIFFLNISASKYQKKFTALK